MLLDASSLTGKATGLENTYSILIFNMAINIDSAIKEILEYEKLDL